MKKNIGILTFWNVPNYGTFLQAYALQKAVELFCPECDARQIAYLDKRHYREYYCINNRKFRFGLLDPRLYLNIFHRIINSNKLKELKAFLEYYENYIPCTEPLLKTELEKKHFDSIILGSDIVWDYSISFFNNDEHLFGNNLSSENILSYAASFGTVKKDAVCPDYVKRGLNKLNSISVRDENSKDLVKQYINKNAEIVCDPTFLWNFNTDENIPEPPETDKYIVVYGSNFSLELISGCVEYARTHNLKIICLDSLDDTFSWCDKNVKQNNLNPFEWLSYFKYAEIIFTCTYHGLMFSLIFNKRVVFSPTEFILDKASSFINYLNLKNVLVDFKSFEEKANWNWNYQKINLKLAELKKSSIDFLKEALE